MEKAAYAKKGKSAAPVIIVLVFIIVIIVIIIIIVLMLINMKIFNWRSMIADKKTVHTTIKTNLQAAESGDEEEEEEEEAEDSEWKTV